MPHNNYFMLQDAFRTLNWIKIKENLKKQGTVPCKQKTKDSPPFLNFCQIKKEPERYSGLDG